MKLVKDPSEFEQTPREDNVIHLQQMTSLELDPNRVLQAAIDADLDGVVIVGWHKGDRAKRSAVDEYFSSSIGDGQTVLWLLQRAAHKMLDMADDEWDVEDNPPTNMA